MPAIIHVVTMDHIPNHRVVRIVGPVSVVNRTFYFDQKKQINDTFDLLRQEVSRINAGAAVGVRLMPLKNKNSESDETMAAYGTAVILEKGEVT